MLSLVDKQLAAYKNHYATLSAMINLETARIHCENRRDHDEIHIGVC